MISKIIIIIFIVINFINIIISSITFDIDCRDIINGGINPSSSSSNSNSGSDYSGEIILNLKNKECKDYHIEELLNNYYIQNNSMITINGNETFGTTIIQSKKQPFLNLINNNSNNNNSNNSTTTKSLISLNITINNINFNNWITPILYIETINNNINFINTNFNNHSNEILISYPIISNNNNDDNSINKTLNSINLNNCKFENFNYLTKLNNLIMPIKLKQTSISVKTSTFINLSMNNTFFHLNQSSLTISNCSTNNITTNNFSFITLINSPTIISNYNHSNSNGSFINHINNNNDLIDFNNENMLIEFSNFNNNLILPQPQPQLELLEQRLQQLNNSDSNSFNENINGFIILDCENKTEKANVLFYSNQFINIIPYNINFNYSIINIKNINLILNNNNIINNININSNSNNNSGIISKANFNNQNLINIVNSNLTLINSTIESDNPIGGEYSTVYIDSPSNDKIGWNKSNNTNSSSSSSSSSSDNNSNSSSSGGGDNNSNGSSGNNKNKNNKLEWCFDCDGCVFSISTDKNVTLTNSDICPDPDAPNNSNDNGNGNGGGGGGGSGKKSYKNTILAVTISAIGIICVALLLTVVILKRRNRKSSFDYLLINQYYLDDEEEKRELLLNRNNNYYYDNNIIDN
ncbi:hypothetical protein ACTFIR_009201 [Dictyostelium discoideum]